ncbi:MAG: ankyrin repeat domain-containing protein [Planctomycetaceae bacterium]|jgi:hypothetical protein|nr:ankyrin repeat domain-containing protein [Planctomycetaceae bacterium]
MSDNFYIELNLFVDPAITDTVALKAELDKKIVEWNKLLNADAKYKHFVQIARAWQNNLNNCNLITLAAEARSIREQQGKEAVTVYEEDGILEPGEYEALHKEFSPFFKTSTIDSWLHLKVSESFIPPEPQYPPEVRKKILSKDDMDKIAINLKIILGNEKASLYDLIGVSPTSSLKTIQQKRQSAYDTAFKKPKTGSDSAKVDTEIQLLGRAKIIFDTDVSRQGYDIALKRRPFDKLIDSKFKRRAIKGGITNEDYQRSIKETLELGFSQTEADWYVYDYYCNTRKLLFPKPVKLQDTSVQPPVSKPKQPFIDPSINSIFDAIKKDNFEAVKIFPDNNIRVIRLWVDRITNGIIGFLNGEIKTNKPIDIHLIFDAIKKDNFEAVKEFVKKDKTLVNKTDDDGETPLHVATMLDAKIEIIQYLIEKSVNINAKNNNGLTPLHHAVRKSNLEIIKYLITKGAKVNEQDNNGYTPFHWAVLASNPDIDVIKYLLKKNTDINVKAKNEMTPLDEANNTGNQIVIDLLKRQQLKNKISTICSWVCGIIGFIIGFSNDGIIGGIIGAIIGGIIGKIFWAMILIILGIIISIIIVIIITETSSLFQ